MDHYFESETAKCFEVVIQLGAILAVVVMYRRRFLGLFDFRPAPETTGFRGGRGILLLTATTIPALVAGVLLHGVIKKYLFGPTTVVAALAVGAVGILLAERLKPAPRVGRLEDLTGREALIIGLFQCLSLWSGMSRSASTIVGGMLCRVERRVAAEYSFLAAVPIMFAATGYDLLKSWHSLARADAPLFVIGFAVSFVTAWIAMKVFIGLLQRWTLVPFAVYRLVVAGLFFRLVLWNAKS